MGVLQIHNDRFDTSNNPTLIQKKKRKRKLRVEGLGSEQEGLQQVFYRLRHNAFLLMILTNLGFSIFPLYGTLLKGSQIMYFYSKFTGFITTLKQNRQQTPTVLGDLLKQL